MARHTLMRRILSVKPALNLNMSPSSIPLPSGDFVSTCTAETDLRPQPPGNGVCPNAQQSSGELQAPHWLPS